MILALKTETASNTALNQALTPVLSVIRGCGSANVCPPLCLKNPQKVVVDSFAGGFATFFEADVEVIDERS